MAGNSTVEEEGVSIVDDLIKGETLQLNTGGERRIGSCVARSELRALGDGMVVSAPDEPDGVTDRGVDGEGDIAKDTLGRSNVDDVGVAGLGGRAHGRRVHGRRGHGGRAHGRIPGVLGLTLLDAVVEGVASPVVTSRTVSGGRLGLIGGG